MNNAPREAAAKMNDDTASMENNEIEQWLADRPTLVDEQNHPNHWYNRASDLHASAGAIWHAMDAKENEIAAELGFPKGFCMSVACLPVYYMLCGLALEVTMKAVLVQRGTSASNYETHRFDTLTQLLGIKPTREERKLLQFYEASLVWAGRYPTPKAATDDKLKTFWSLGASVLTSPVKEIKGIELRTGNDAGHWNNFTKLWHSYSILFEHK